MPRFKVQKKLEATWNSIDAPTISDAILRARKIKPDKQLVLESKAQRIED